MTRARASTGRVPTTYPRPERLRGVVAPPDALLRTYTSTELRAIELANAEAAREAEIQARTAERKVQADRQREHFTLTPNDEPQRKLL